jgi:hypothetical protein
MQVRGRDTGVPKPLWEQSALCSLLGNNPLICHIIGSCNPIMIRRWPRYDFRVIWDRSWGRVTHRPAEKRATHLGTQSSGGHRRTWNFLSTTLSLQDGQKPLYLWR